MELQLETAVSHATVYPDRARVTVQGACNVEAGQLTLWVDELPLVLEPESVRVTGKGTAKVRLRGVDVSRHYYVDSPSGRVQELEKQVEQVAEELRARQDEKEGWLAEAKYLDGLRTATAEFARGLSRGRIDVTQQGKLLAFLRDEEAQLKTAVRKLDAEIRSLTKQVEKLRKELQTMQAAQPRQRFRAKIEAEVLTAGEFQLSLSYMVQQAGWRPLYDVCLQADNEAPNLVVSTIAQVQQNSGQDWSQVSLSVSTARPAINQRLPELKPWYVDELVAQPRAVMAQPMLKTAAMGMAAAEMEVAVREAMPAPVVAEAEVAMAEVQEGSTAVSFQVSGSVDIPGDGSLHKTILHQASFPPALDYLAIPKHTDAVFRRARLINNSAAPMLSGIANLFVDDEFIGQNQLPYVPVNGELKLLLGVEERITVTRELARREVEKRFMQDIRQLRYGYKLVLKNLLALPVQVELHDHIPVSRHEQIKVKLENVQPAPAQKSDLNLLEWHLKLAAQAEQTVVYDYLVEYPRSMQVRGLID